MIKPLSHEHKLFLRERKKRAAAIGIAQIGFLVFALLFWEIAARLGWIDAFITSSPSRVIKMAAELAKSGELWKHVWISTYETVVGFAIGTLLGGFFATLMWWSDFVKRVFEPYVVVLNSLPKIALGPIIIIWVGTGAASIIVMAVLISVVITTITMLNGFCETNSGKILLLQTMRANKFQIFTKLVLPSNVPTLLSTLKINVGMAWVGTIMGEYLVSKAGLGYLIVYGGQIFKLDLVMTCTILLCVLAGLMYGAVALLERKIVRWKN